MTIYVGNISHSANEQDIEQLFAQYGDVSSVKLIKDHETGRSKGFGFIEMDDDTQGQEAIDSLNQQEFMSRPLVVNIARPRTERPRQGGGGFNRSFNRDGGRDFNRDRGGYNRNY